MQILNQINDDGDELESDNDEFIENECHQI